MCYADTMHGDAAEDTKGDDAMNTRQLQRAIGSDTNRRKISVVPHVVLLQLGENMFAIRVLAEHSDVWTDLVDEQFALWWIGNVNHTLYYVVCKLVFHHCVQCRLWPMINAHNVTLHQLITQTVHMLLQEKIMCTRCTPLSYSTNTSSPIRFN